MIDSKTIAEKALQCLRLMEAAGMTIHDQGAGIAIMNILLGNKLKQLETSAALHGQNAQIVDAMPIPADEVFRQ